MQPTTETAAARHYGRMRIQTASHTQAICMLHERACILCKKARQRPGESMEIIVQIQNILAQLQSSLTNDDDISKSLLYLYDYCYVLLERPQGQTIDSAFKVLSILTDAFMKIARKVPA